MKPQDTRPVPAIFNFLRRKPLLAILAVLLASLLVAEIALLLALRAGWQTYRGFDMISAMAVDTKGQAWVAGYRQNVPSLMTYSETSRPVELSMPGELTRTAPSALMIDNQERLWVGTEEGMLGMRNPNGEWSLYAPEQYGIDSIRQIVMDGKGQVLVRSHRGPAMVDIGSSERRIAFTNSGLPESDVVALAADPLEQLWLLTRKRELKVLEANGNWRTLVIVPATVRNGFMDSFLTFGPQGQIWLATVRGVGLLGPNGAWTEYPLGDPSRPLSMRAVLADAHGRVWVAAGDQGLFLLNPQDGWTNHTGQNSGLSFDANVLALAPQERVWIGSSHGRVSTFHPEAALPVNSVAAIRNIARRIIPAALLSVLVLAIVAAPFRSPIQGNEKKLAAFVLAFAGWFAIGTLLWGYIRYAHAQSGGMFFINPLALIPPLLNILLLIVLYGLQRRMAWGALSALLVNWIGLIFVTPAALPFGGAPFMETLFMLPFFLPP